ncbi:hypothetical protein CspeluHIS016_0101410 [Cutaneotrichosporon spelunceum]|uniref:Ketoreductase domain-containing protein n=1 Tax=Cutaneotrichosporon spelunceum TaxID=1672016 RepID=A0AAD3Y7D0_9TREE|nr:hypothetical protein CspeluHIS016_0101410 [Cutaneotrichosporon spelunceum]
MLLAPMNGVALVTGAASGIGQATARAFIRAGVKRLTCSDVQADKLDALKAEYANNDVDILAVTCNVADSGAVKSMVNATVERFGRLDYAVNCAGIAGVPGRMAAIEDKDWDKVIGVNQSGVFYSMREQLAVMSAQEPLDGASDERRAQRGAIVNIASIAGLVGVGGLPGYVASKHAVVGLAKAAAAEYSGAGIRINNIAPGYIDTPMTQMAEVDADLAHLPPVPIQRPGRPEEIADVAVFLCSEGASFVTGATWPVDGGYTSL